MYKVIFTNQTKIYEIYAQTINQSGILGFVEVEKLVFGENTTMVVDPNEESLKCEFEGVERTYIPMHSVIRIDEVTSKGTSKITDAKTGSGNITPFPVYPNNPNNK